MYFGEKGSPDKSTIVFIHGGGVSGWMWKKQWEAFADYHILLPDLPEHGGSIGDGEISIERSAEEIARLIRERAKNGRAHVVGHSLGAKIVVQMLSAYPDVIDHAVVASALFRPIPMLNLFLNMPIYKLTARMMQNEKLLNKQAAQMQFPDDFYTDNFKRDVKLQTPEMLARIYGELNKHLDLPAGLSAAAAPVMALAGEKEPGAMRLSVRDIVQALPNAKGFLVAGGKHNFPWTLDETFNACIRAWIEDKPVLETGVHPF